MKSLTAVRVDSLGKSGIGANRALAVLLSCIGLSAAAGCSADNNASASNHAAGAGKPAAEQPIAETRTADQVLKNMETTYRNAKSYADKGEVRRKFTRDGQPMEQVFDFAVAFVRPNKLRVDCYGARVACDGSQFWASAPHLPNMVLQLPAPAQLKIDDVTRHDNLTMTLTQGPAGPPVQLPFLIEQDTLQQLLRDAMAPPKLLSPEQVEGQWCNRVAIDGAEGPMTMWIDQRTNLIRRIELPTAAAGDTPDGNEKTQSLAMEFREAQIDKPIGDDAFKFDVPTGAQVVDALVERLQPTAAAPRSEPASLKLSKLWTVEGVKDPGNMLIVDGPDGKPRIFVVDGWRAVVEIDSAGKVVARHELEIPPNVAISYLRSGLDKDGKRYFVASASGQSQLHLFDENWKCLLSFPKPEDGAAEGIGDVEIVDLAGDGTPELCVGYWGDVGVQGVSLNGQRDWRDRSLQFVLQMAPTAPDAQGHRKLLCTHSRGTLVPLSHEGKPEKEIAIPNRHLHTIVSGDLEGNGQSSYCALAGSPNDDNAAIGLSLEGRELWNYPLPKGVSGRPIDMVSIGDITAGDAREWLLAGPDASIHILAADGTPIDKFNHGATLSGLGPVKLGDQRVLLISSLVDKPTGDQKGVLEAWAVDPAAK